MNFQEVFKRNKLDIFELVASTPSVFFNLPYSEIKENFFLSEQLKYVNDESFLAYLPDFMKRLLEHPNKDEVDPELFVSVFTNSNKIYNLNINGDKLIERFICEHKDSKKILKLIIAKYKTHQKLVHSISDIVLSMFDREIYDCIVDNDFEMFNAIDYSSLISDESVITMFKETAFKNVKKQVEKVVSGDVQSWSLYNIPTNYLELLSDDEIFHILKYAKEYNQGMYLIIINSWLDPILSYDLSVRLKDELDIEISSKYMNDEIIKRNSEKVKITVDYKDAYKHIEDGSYFSILNTKKSKRFIESLLNVNVVIKDERNLIYLQKVIISPSLLPKDFLIDIIENNYEYFKSSTYSTTFHRDFLYSIYVEYMKLTERIDINKAFNNFIDLVNGNLGIVIRSFSRKDVLTPEYLNLLFNYDRDIALKLIGRIMDYDPNFLYEE